MSDTMQDEFYTASEAAHVLGMTDAELTARSEHILNLGKTSYYRWYVDELAAILRISTARGYDVYDAITVELYWLRWLYGHNKTIPYKEESRNRLKELLENGTVVTITTLHTLLSDVATLNTIFAWAQKHRLMTVKIGKHHYLSATYAAWLQEIYTWPTLAELSKRTGCHSSTILNRYQRGWFITCTPPNGVLRVSPKSPLSLVEAAKVIGTTQITMRRAVRENTIPHVKIGKRLFIEHSIVILWHTRFRTLNHTSFAWLQDRLNHEARTLSVKQVSRMLGVSEPTVSRWLNKGSLPYYDRSMSSGVCPTIHIPIAYIDGILRFSRREALRINHSTVKRYKAICEDQSRTR